MSELTLYVKVEGQHDASMHVVLPDAELMVLPDGGVQLRGDGVTVELQGRSDEVELLLETLVQALLANRKLKIPAAPHAAPMWEE